MRTTNYHIIQYFKKITDLSFETFFFFADSNYSAIFTKCKLLKCMNALDVLFNMFLPF